MNTSVKLIFLLQIWVSRIGTIHVVDFNQLVMCFFIFCSYGLHIVLPLKVVATANPVLRAPTIITMTLAITTRPTTLTTMLKPWEYTVNLLKCSHEYNTK